MSVYRCIRCWGYKYPQISLHGDGYNLLKHCLVNLHVLPRLASFLKAIRSYH